MYIYLCVSIHACACVHVHVFMHAHMCVGGNSHGCHGGRAEDGEIAYEPKISSIPPMSQTALFCTLTKALLPLALTHEAQGLQSHSGSGDPPTCPPLMGPSALALAWDNGWDDLSIDCLLVVSFVSSVFFGASCYCCPSLSLPG